MEYQKLFDHMLNEHGLTLLQSEMQEIIEVVREIEGDGWVRVEESLPVDGQSVLTRCVGFSPSGYEIADYFSRFESQANGDDIDRYVTHWTPLNKPNKN